MLYYYTINKTKQFFESDIKIDEDVATLATEEDIVFYNFNQVKTKKLQELDIYHNGDIVKSITINKIYTTSTSKDQRGLIQEQIDFMKAKAEITKGDINTFIWKYQLPNSATIVPLNFTALNKIIDFIGDVVKKNFLTYQDHLNNIKNLDTIEEIEKYDFTTGYIINQNLTL